MCGERDQLFKAGDVAQESSRREVRAGMTWSSIREVGDGWIPATQGCETNRIWTSWIWSPGRGVERGCSSGERSPLKHQPGPSALRLGRASEEAGRASLGQPGIPDVGGGALEFPGGP